MIACMEEAGFKPKRVDGGYELDFRPEQASAALEAAEICGNKSLGLEPGASVPALKDEDFTRYYWRLVDSMICLSEAGFEVSDPPSLVSFIETQSDNWNPYRDIATTESLDRSNEAEVACPPPDF